ncbi:MAG: hypothetical protein J6R59_02780 [Paludibacteraceae bacterium]|nr:hypothetical protein [Paludibacteraceae bacterium]
MFPKATNFEYCFNNSCFDCADIAFLGGAGTSPNVTLNCSGMFSYAAIGSYINVDISDNVTDLSNVFINANTMFSEVTFNTYASISCSNRFMSRLKYADYMFTNCVVEGADSWNECRYLESANEMFRGAHF